jgi:hypothetical protein
MTTKSTTKTNRTDLYNTVETITLPTTKLQVKYINPSVLQASTFHAFVLETISKLHFTPKEINSLTYLQLKEKTEYELNKLKDDVDKLTDLVGQMLIVDPTHLLTLISDCFPEIDNPRLIRSDVLNDIIKILFSAKYN